MRHSVRSRRKFIFATGVLLALECLFICSGTRAAEPGDTDSLQPIVVTAQRRSENVQDVPISVQVVSGATLGEQNFNSLVDLTQTLSDVHVGAGARSNDMYIRGIGSGVNQSFDQSVGTFIDDVYFGRSHASDATFLDIDRVEVLRGPQSTYFGNNAIAGALNIVTKKPGSEFQTSGRALYGMFGQYAIEGEAGGPINDVFGVRIALTRTGENGYLYNTDLDRHEPTDNNLAGRVTFTFHPSEDFDATLKAEGSDNRTVGGEGTFQQVGNCPPPPPFSAAGFCKTIIAQGLPTGTNTNLTALPGGQGQTFDLTDYALTLNYRRWNQVFTSVSGFYDYHFNLGVPANETKDNGPALFSVQAPERYDQFSQEFRVASEPGHTLDYLAGVYLQTDTLNFMQNIDYPFIPLPPPFAPLGSSTSFEQGEHSYAVFGALTWNITDQLRAIAGLRGTEVRKTYDYSNVFGNATEQYGGVVPFAGSPCTTTTAATGLQAVASSFGIGAACQFSSGREDKDWLPSIKLEYSIASQIMAYFSFSQGFKAGGFNGADVTGVASNLPYQPEHVNAYELGLKSQWLDNKLLFNVDVFRSNYRNLQVAETIVSGAGAVESLVKNAAASQSQGVELETQWVVVHDFSLAANITYLDSHYVSYPNAGLTTLGTFCSGAANRANGYCMAAYGPTGNPGLFQNLAGQPTSFAPTWSASVAATYTARLPGDYRFVGQLSPYFTSHYFLSGAGTNDPYLAQSGYMRLDARLTFETPDRRWALDLLGKNLTDRTILESGLGLPASLGSFIYGKEMPRNVAIQIRFQK